MGAGGGSQSASRANGYGQSGRDEGGARGGFTGSRGYDSGGFGRSAEYGAPVGDREGRGMRGTRAPWGARISGGYGIRSDDSRSAVVEQ
jgi:hypothetical protein